MGLMMLGNIGIATVIATLTATLLSERTSEDWVLSLLLLAIGVTVLWALAKSVWIERQLNRPIAFALRRFSHLDVRDYVSLLNLSSGFAVYELLVESNDWLAGKTLVELGLAREGVLVLGIPGVVRREVTDEELPGVTTTGVHVEVFSAANEVPAWSVLQDDSPTVGIQEHHQLSAPVARVPVL